MIIEGCSSFVGSGLPPVLVGMDCREGEAP
jgi:hypothetical protein